MVLDLLWQMYMGHMQREYLPLEERRSKERA